jgi:hypothetical protein
MSNDAQQNVSSYLTWSKPVEDVASSSLLNALLLAICGNVQSITDEVSLENSGKIFHNEADLTASGQSTASRDFENFKQACIYWQAVDINPGEKVILVPEASVDGNNWYPVPGYYQLGDSDICVQNPNFAIAENGKGVICISNLIAKFIRVTYQGGTASGATISIELALGN